MNAAKRRVHIGSCACWTTWVTRVLSLLTVLQRSYQLMHASRSTRNNSLILRQACAVAFALGLHASKVCTASWRRVFAHVLNRGFGAAGVGLAVLLSPQLEGAARLGLGQTHKQSQTYIGNW